ncbi:unnamed protein product [Boreogadus saida]
MRRREHDIKVKQICKSKKRSEHWEKLESPPTAALSPEAASTGLTRPCSDSRNGGPCLRWSDLALYYGAQHFSSDRGNRDREDSANQAPGCWSLLYPQDGAEASCVVRPRTCEGFMSISEVCRYPRVPGSARPRRRPGETWKSLQPLAPQSYCNGVWENGASHHL